jgi:16S rRNA G527 N7-methylase RsmG
MSVSRETHALSPDASPPSDWVYIAEWVAPRAATLGLTTFARPADFLHQMMLPALALPMLLPANLPATICEIGPGSGGIGLALATLSTDAHVTLADRRQRVVSFLDLAIHIIGLPNAHAVRSDLGPHADTPAWDLVCFRALALPAQALSTAAAHSRQSICAWHSPTSIEYDHAPAGFEVRGRVAVTQANLVATLYARA